MNDLRERKWIVTENRKRRNEILVRQRRGEKVKEDQRGKKKNFILFYFSSKLSEKIF